MDELVIKQLQDEELHHKKNRNTLVNAKLAVVSALLGLGGISIALRSLIENIEGVFFIINVSLYAAPLIAVSYDLFIFAEDYKVHRVTAFIRHQRGTFINQPTLLQWEEWCSTHREATAIYYGSAGLTLITVFPGFFAYITHHEVAYIPLLSSVFTFLDWLGIQLPSGWIAKSSSRIGYTVVSDMISLLTDNNVKLPGAWLNEQGSPVINTVISDIIKEKRRPNEYFYELDIEQWKGRLFISWLLLSWGLLFWVFGYSKHRHNAMMLEPQEIPCPVGTPIRKLYNNLSSRLLRRLSSARRDLVIIIPAEKRSYALEWGKYQPIKIPYDKYRDIKYVAEYTRDPTFAITQYAEVATKNMYREEGVYQIIAKSVPNGNPCTIVWGNMPPALREGPWYVTLKRFRYALGLNKPWYEKYIFFWKSTKKRNSMSYLLQPYSRFSGRVRLKKEFL